MSVSSNNPSALSVRHLSNMLINGSAFTRATPLILPEPVIHGFSEIAINGVPNIASNGRPILQSISESLSDDIYIYNSNSLSNRRVSLSKFSFPTNYLQGTNMPSHRFPQSVEMEDICFLVLIQADWVVLFLATQINHPFLPMIMVVEIYFWLI